MQETAETGDSADLTLQELDLALEADLKALAKKASSGKLLSGQERAMLQDYRARLIKKTEPAFKLEGEGVRSELARLSLDDLAKRWGYSVRQIKNWVADGKAALDPCPVRQPDKMVEWFERVYAPRSCPARISQKAGELCLEVGSTPAAVVEKEVALPLLDRSGLNEDEKGLFAMLERLRDAEAYAHKAYMQALDAGNQSRADFLGREWLKLSEQVRAAEKSAPKALEEAGIYVRKDLVARELGLIHSAILKTLRQNFRKAFFKISNLESQDEWNRAIDSLISDSCEMLCETSFAEPLELSAA